MNERIIQIRYTLALLLGMCTTKYFPKLDEVGGGYTEEGFYYTFRATTSLEPSDLAYIRNDMAKWMSSRLRRRPMGGLRIAQEPVTKEELIKRLEVCEYNSRLRAAALLESPVNLVHLGERWFDIQRFPTLASTAELDADLFELTGAEEIHEEEQDDTFLIRINGKTSQAE